MCIRHLDQMKLIVLNEVYFCFNGGVNEQNIRFLGSENTFKVFSEPIGSENTLFSDPMGSDRYSLNTKYSLNHHSILKYFYNSIS